MGTNERSSQSTEVVYKYRLKPGAHTVEMPGDALLLHVASQGSQAFVWALVDPKAVVVKRKIATLATGVEFVAEDSSYVGTFTIREDGGAFGEMVFHVFDYGEV